MLRAHPCPTFTEIRPERITSAGRLEAEQPAAGRRNPDRASPITGVCRRDHASRDRSSRPATGPAGNPAGVPGIQSRAVQHRLCREVEPQLQRVRTAQNHQAGSFESSYDLGVVFGHMLGPETATRRRWLSGVVGAQVLEEKGHSCEWAVDHAAGHLAAGALVGTMNQRSQLVEVLDAIDGCLQHRDRVGGTLADRGSQTDRIQAGIVVDHGCVRCMISRNPPHDRRRRIPIAPRWSVPPAATVARGPAGAHRSIDRRVRRSRSERPEPRRIPNRNTHGDSVGHELGGSDGIALSAHEIEVVEEFLPRQLAERPQ